jgi:hypothetical protein
MSFRPFLAFIAFPMVLLGLLGCVDRPSGTGEAALYVYDNASGQVLVWDDTQILHDQPSNPPEPDRTIRSGTLKSCGPLWGGLAVDAATDCLYLAGAKGGSVTRLSKASTQKGTALPVSAFATFHLGTDHDRFRGGSLFGPASVNAKTGILYVTETSGDRRQCRVWVIPSADRVPDDETVSVETAIARVGGDQGFPSVVGGQGTSFFGFFPHGKTVYNLLGLNGQDGPRLRFGSEPKQGFGITSGVIAGPSTLLLDPAVAPTYGCLAFDALHNQLYVSRQASSSTLPAVVVFGAGQWQTSFDQTPLRHLDDKAHSLSRLRFLVHGGQKDWLAGADWLPPELPPASGGMGGEGTHLLHLWKHPKDGGASITVNLKPGVEVGGLALAGRS